jgi:hypothetical protein
MNYENQIYKINDNLYIINWFNFLKIEYDVKLSEETNFITNYKRSYYKYINYEDIYKYNFDDLIYDELVDKYKKLKERKNDFPYPLLNIDYADELLYKNENNEWYLLKYTSYDTNKSLRCQQGEYKEYKIELSNIGTYDLVIKRNLLEPFKYRQIYDEHYKILFHKKKTTFEKVELNKDHDDPIVNILFSNKFPLYFYPSYDYIAINEIMDICVGIKMIELEGNEEKVIIKYNNKEYYYAQIHFYLCCGSGTDSFIQLDSKADMEYFNHEAFWKDEKMQKHFEYLRTEKN